MKRRPRRNLLIAAAVGTFFVCNAAAQETCKPTTIGTVSVAAVRDGRTIALADGRELRLAGIEVTGDSRAVWQALVAGHPLRLERLGPGQDRYGRLVAFAFAGDAEPFVQQAMLEQGQARVSARDVDKACAEGLLSAEKAARAAGRGLWADPNFAPLSAENHFGRHWTRDFTVIIFRRMGRAFAAAGVEPKKLEGRRIRLRGWIEQRGGPIISAETPEQIEFAD
jgi:endonuclease YncB( thermonuclease family)